MASKHNKHTGILSSTLTQENFYWSKKRSSAAFLICTAGEPVDNDRQKLITKQK
jgi:hypothetical protein